MDKLLPVFFVVVAALLQAVSAALIKLSSRMKQEQPDKKLYIWVFILAFLLYGPSFFLWAQGLGWMNLAVAQPIYSGTMFMGTLLLSMLMFRERIKPYKYFGFLAIIGGIVLVVI